LYRNYLNIH